MAEVSAAAHAADLVECPLCLGRGRLTRSEILDRLDMKDFARVAQLSAEEAFRLILQKQKGDEQSNWSRFEAELTKRTNEITQGYKKQFDAIELEKGSLKYKLQEMEKGQDILIKNATEAQRLEDEKKVQSQVSELDGRVKDLEAERKVHEDQKNIELDKLRNQLQAEINVERAKIEELSRKNETHLSEIGSLKEHNKEIEAELAKVARIGKREEMDFHAEARSWPGIWISDKLSRYGDYILAFRDLSGEPLDPRMVVDNKDKDSLSQSDVDKIVRDAGEQKTPVGILVTREEDQLRQVDRERRWLRTDGIWVLRTTRAWLSRDLDLLRPILERMRIEGPDFLERNIELAKEVKRSFEDLDELDKELGKAGKAIENSKELVLKYRKRLQELCDSIAAKPAASDTRPGG